jgi:hypothetical protein
MINSIRIYRARKCIIESTITSPSGVKIIDKEKTFLTNQTAYICDHLCRIVEKTDTGKVRLLNIMASEDFADFEIHDYRNIIDLDVPFDFPMYLHASVELKQTMIMTLLEKALEYICREKKWDNSVFFKALDTIKQSGFENKYMYGKKVFNSNRDYAYLWLEHDMNHMNIYIHVIRRDGQKKSLHIIETGQSAFVYFNHIGKIRWIDRNVLELITFFGTTQYCIDDFQNH